MFVAEAPGPDEEEEGRPLVGPSGYVFHEAGLTPAKIERTAVRVENVNQCKAPAESARGREAQRQCGPSLQHVIAAMPNLRFIVAMGEPALRWVSGYAESEIARKELEGARKKHEKKRGTYLRRMTVYHDKLRDYEASMRDYEAGTGKKRKPPKEPPDPGYLAIPEVEQVGWSGITKWRGSILSLTRWLASGAERGFWLYPMLHPAAVMAFRQPRLKPLFTADFLKAARHARGQLPIPTHETTVIRTGEEAARWFGSYPFTEIGIDIENSSQNNTLECFAMGGGASYALVPWRDLDAGNRSGIATEVQRGFDNRTLAWGGHNVSGYDERKLGEYGFSLRTAWDSLCGFHVAFAELGSSRDDNNEDLTQASGYDLGFVTSVLTPFPYHKGVVSGTRDASTVSNDELYPYCVLDVRSSWFAYQAIKREFRARYAGGGIVGHALMRADMDRARRAAEMGRSGLPILEERRAGKLQELEAKAARLEAQTREICGGDYNPHSKPQLAAKLQEMGVKLYALTPTGRAKLDAKVMDRLSERYPANPLLQVDKELRGLREKEIAVYKWMEPRQDGSVEISWKVHGTVGPRWSSTPNAQNLTSTQKNAVGALGFEVIVADLSAAELWVIATLAGQKDLIRQLQSGESPHYATCKELYGRDINKREELEEYTFGKSANYRWCYTLPDEALALEGGQLRTAKVNVNPERLARVTAWLNRRWAAIVAWKRRTIREAESTGFAYSPQGRFRDLRWAFRSHAPKLKHHAARAAINFPIQSAIGEVTGEAFVEAFDKLAALNKERGKFVARLFANEHDSLAAIARPECVVQVEEILTRAMNRAIPSLGDLRIPVEVKRGPSWGEAH